MSKLVETAKYIESVEHEDGWGQPAKLLVLDPAGLLAVIVFENEDMYEALEVITPYHDAQFVAFVSEGWTYPKSLLDEYDSAESMENLYRTQPPSEHPQRKQVRNVIVCTKDDEAYVVRFEEGEEIDVMTRIDGRFPEQVRRIAGKT